jgi:hypothetical protein
VTDCVLPACTQALTCVTQQQQPISQSYLTDRTSLQNRTTVRSCNRGRTHGRQPDWYIDCMTASSWNRRCYCIAATSAPLRLEVGRRFFWFEKRRTLLDINGTIGAMGFSTRSYSFRQGKGMISNLTPKQGCDFLRKFFNGL